MNWDKFEVEGIAVARAIKKELPDWTVVWHDDRKLMALIVAGLKNSPRSEFEFEVLRDGSLVAVVD